MGCRSHASSSPFPQRQPAPASPRRLRQFGFRKKHTRTQACELPTQPSVGFLLAGRSGSFTVRERKSGPRPCPSLWIRWAGFCFLCLPAPVPNYGTSLGSSSCWSGVAAVSPCSIARVALQSCQVQLRCLDISVLGRGLAHCAGLSWAMLLAGAPFTKNTAFVYF